MYYPIPEPEVFLSTAGTKQLSQRVQRSKHTFLAGGKD